MKKNILSILVVVTLLITPLAGMQVAKADFLSCVAKGGNVGKCLEENQNKEPTTSFTNFQGGLTAPSAEGYSPKLTEAKDVRTYALNVTNFALGFLALIAVLIIIYGGFLYVTAAGKEDQAGKGKKAISYAVIGILIIMGSFAIVNTVLQAPGGKEGAMQGAAPTGASSTANTKQRFNVLANKISTIAQDLFTAYKFHFEAMKEMAEIKTLVTCVKQSFPNQCNTPDLFTQSFDNAIRKIENAENYVKSQSGVDSVAIINALDNLKADLISHKNKTLAAAQDAAAKAMAKAKDLEVAQAEQDAIKNSFYDTDSETSPYQAVLEALKNNIKAEVRTEKLALKEMYAQVSPITDIAEDKFKKLIKDESFLQNTDLIPQQDLIDAAAGSLKDLAEAISKANDQTEPLDTQLYNVLGDYSNLYAVLKDIVFVDARITASVTEGNAPLVVNFSSVGSLDPSGLTIQDSQISWDLNGDGKFNDKTFVSYDDSQLLTIAHAASPQITGITQNFGLIAAGNKFMNCNEANKATVSCTFMQPGTYRVRLKITPSNSTDPATGKKYSDEIGAGIASITIKVNPPQTKIKLSVDNNEGGQFYLMDYDENGFLTVNRTSVAVLASKASNQGVKFNAKLTETKEGLISAQAAQGATIKWDFGDGSKDEYNNAILPATEDNLSPLHKYSKEGSYTVTAEFTDKNGNVDRKIFNVIVSSIAPLMQIHPTQIKLGDQVTFDGSGSASDNGPLKYSWKIAPDLSDLAPANLEKDSFQYKFTKSGPYAVSLKVEDPITNAETSPEQLIVTSKPPVSQFRVENPDKAQPGTYVFDGSRSYDPDGTEQLAYQWEINGQKLPATADYEFVAPSTPTSQKAVVKFKNVGTYAITLLVTDPSEPNPAGEKPVEKEIQVDNILDIAWGDNDVTSSVLKADASGQLGATISLSLSSDSAVAYEVDYGDGTKENGDMSKKATLTHVYKTAGAFVVKASVYDANDNGNSLSRKVYIGSGTQPVAVIGVSVNGEKIIPKPGDPLVINRKDVVTFDAYGSRNTDGTGRRLNYSWDLGDGQLSTKDKITHTYKNIGSYKLTLKAINVEDVSQFGTDTLDLEVKGESPTLQSLTAVPISSSLTTPVTVQLEAIGATDPDGKVVKYRWWYYDPSNDADELGVQVSTSPTANIVIGTRGDEGEQKTYKFGVELTDNENNTVSSMDLIDEKAIPELTVTNGPNKAPIAKFNVDHTDISVGESVNFASSSIDPDGQIKAYYWDFEGNGFADNTKAEGSNVTHVFTSPAPNGIRVKLKVVDNNESEAISDPVVIYVSGKAQPPTAAFSATQEDSTKKVAFKNNSTADTASGANIDKYSWDFDTATDSNGDGKKDNDSDSAEKDPVHEYPDFGIYRAKLTVTDSEGNKSEISNFVSVKAPSPEPQKPAPSTPKPSGQQPQPVVPLDARLLTTPSPSFVDGKIHLTGETATVTFDYSTSVGNITKYSIDKNIYYDTNGNGIKDDDEDYVSTAPGQWTTSYSRSYGNVKVRLTVTDGAGKKDTVEKDIVFDQPAGSIFTANIFGLEDVGIAALLVIAAVFAIMTTKGLIGSINKNK
jgi:PKD repeat protein